MWGRKPHNAEIARIVRVEGPRGVVLVVGLGYHLKDLPRAFGPLETLHEYEANALLRAVPPGEWTSEPIEVWLNGVLVGEVAEELAGRYWRQMRKAGVLVSCGCVIRTTGLTERGGFPQVSKLRLSLPEALPPLLDLPEGPVAADVRDVGPLL